MPSYLKLIPSLLALCHKSSLFNCLDNHGNKRNSSSTLPQFQLWLLVKSNNKKVAACVIPQRNFLSNSNKNISSLKSSKNCHSWLWSWIDWCAIMSDTNQSERSTLMVWNSHRLKLFPYFHGNRHIFAFRVIFCYKYVPCHGKSVTRLTINRCKPEFN